jgi:hypothetical protein
MAKGGLAFCGGEWPNRLVGDEENGSAALHTSFAESLGWLPNGDQGKLAGGDLN